MLEKLKRRLNLADNNKDALLNDLLEDAEQAVLSYTGRQNLPAALGGVVCELAAASYGLRGLEGQAAHGEGGLSVTVDRLPASMRAQLGGWRVARIGGE